MYVLSHYERVDVGTWAQEKWWECVHQQVTKGPENVFSAVFLKPSLIMSPDSCVWNNSRFISRQWKLSAEFGDKALVIARDDLLLIALFSWFS